ncbi:MAG: hypothetical protein ABSC64_20715 [Candidatus Korobacteraceae bacterium]|jgi:hypothetical protein
MKHNGLHWSSRQLFALAECPWRLSLSSLFLLVTCFSRHAVAQQPCVFRNNPTIIYTGQTYGYLRDNDHWKGPSGAPSAGDAVAATYKSLSCGWPQAILVGMGDNFAPEYGARYTNFKPGYDSSTAIPVLRTPQDAPLSNHAVLFFATKDLPGKGENPEEPKTRLAYNALVPGQMDFYFGAQFLRNAGLKALPLLASNLMITSAKQTSPPQPLCGPSQLLLPTQVSMPMQSSAGSSGGKGKSGGKSGQSSSGSSSGQSSSGQSGQVCLQPSTQNAASAQGGMSLIAPSPDSVYPWTTEFEYSLPASVNRLPVTELAALLCPTGKPCFPLSDPKPIAPQNRNDPVTYVSELSPDVPIDPKNGTLRDFANCSISTLTTSTCVPFPDVSLCVQQKGNPKTQQCTPTPLHVQTPLFQRTWVEVNKGALHYVVFGVLDPAIQGLISPENSSWGNDREYTAQISIPDPAAPLEQLVAAFEKLHPTPLPAGEKRVYVLLAQMQPAQARALAATLQYHQNHPPSYPPAYHPHPFDVVLSAADYDQATPDMTLALKQEQMPIPAITPHPLVFQSTMRNPLEVFEIDNPSANRTEYTNYTDNNTDSVGLVEAELVQTFATAKGTFTNACGDYQYINAILDRASDTVLGTHQAPPAPCNLGSSFKCLALKTMRDSLNGDAALIQRREFYANCNYEGPTAGSASGEMVDRVLWNSGYLTRAAVSGSTLTAILQASNTIATQEKSSTTSSLQYNQDLTYLGITKAGGLYYINGAALDNSKIYSIAISDQVSKNNAYPQFLQVDLVSPAVFTDLDLKLADDDNATLEIAGLARHALVPSLPLVSLHRAAIVAPYDFPAVMSSLSKGPNPSGDPFKDSGPVEKGAQRRNLWTVTLQQASVGYTNSKANQTDGSINKNLAGVTNPNVAAPESDNLSYSDSVRVLYQLTKHWNLGLDQVITFARSRQGSLSASAEMTPSGRPIPAESISLSSNTLIVSPFIEFQPYRYQGHWKAVARPVTFSTGLARAPQYFSTMTKGEEYELNLRRQENWQPSLGGRYEWSNLQFFEVGYLNQTARNILSALTVNGKTMPLTAGTTVAEILNVTPKSGDVAIPIYETFHQQGAYWLGMYTKPLVPGTNRFVYQGTTYGNFFAYGPATGEHAVSTALTRYAASLNNTIQVQIWGNVTFGPGYNVFWFQDQSHGPGSSLTRQGWNVQLNYLFDWHQGLVLKDALGGKISP